MAKPRIKVDSNKYGNRRWVCFTQNAAGTRIEGKAYDMREAYNKWLRNERWHTDEVYRAARPSRRDARDQELAEEFEWEMEDEHT